MCLEHPSPQMRDSCEFRRTSFHWNNLLYKYATALPLTGMAALINMQQCSSCFICNANSALDRGESAGTHRARKWHAGEREMCACVSVCVCVACSSTLCFATASCSICSVWLCSLLRAYPLRKVLKGYFAGSILEAPALWALEQMVI